MPQIQNHFCAGSLDCCVVVDFLCGVCRQSSHSSPFCRSWVKRNNGFGFFVTQGVKKQEKKSSSLKG